MLTENLWKIHLLQKDIMYSQCFESFFQVKTHFFIARAEQSWHLNILRETFYNRALFIKNQTNASDYSIQ